MVTRSYVVLGFIQGAYSSVFPAASILIIVSVITISSRKDSMPGQRGMFPTLVTRSSYRAIGPLVVNFPTFDELSLGGFAKLRDGFEMGLQ
jgi:hypothetical protein